MTDDVKFVEIPATDPRLGRHVEHDPRSRAFAFAAPAAVPQVNVRHTRYIEIFDQGNLGSCTGNSGMGCLGTSGFYETVRPLVSDWTEAAAVKLYSEATVVDGFPGDYPPDDTGSSGLAIAKVLKKRGWISEYRHAFSFDDALAALQIRPVITGVNWYRSFFRPDSNGIIHLDPASGIAGGHEFVLDEIDWDRKLIGAQNSWGTSWGDKGRFYIPFDVFKRLMDEDGDVTVFTPINVAPQPTPEPPIPSPEPVDPVPENADETLWTLAKDWANSRHYSKTKKVSDALKIWAHSKGLTD